MKHLQKDDEIIDITIADGLSGTYHSACTAKDDCPHNDNIHVFNSKTLCGPTSISCFKSC